MRYPVVWYALSRAKKVALEPEQLGSKNEKTPLGAFQYAVPMSALCRAFCGRL